MTLKKQQKWGLFWLGLGIVLNVLAALNGWSGPLSGIGAGFMGVGVAWLLRAGRLMKDPEKAADYEASLRDERTTYIAGKARNMVFFLSIYVELAVGVAGMYFLNQRLLGGVMLALVCAQAFAYTGFYWYYGSKY